MKKKQWYYYSISSAGSSGLGFRYGYEFDGVDEYIDFGNVLDLTGTDPFSFSFCVKPVAAGMILSKCQYSFPGLGYYISVDNNGRIEFTLRVNASSNKLVVRGANVGLNVWNICTIIYDGSQNGSGVKIYSNGVEGSTIITDNLTTSVSNSFDFNIGSINNGNTLFNGRLDDVQFYDFELNATQVSDIYNSGYVTAPTAAPIHHWKLGEEDTFSTNWTVKDSVGSLDGTSVNMEEVDRKLGVAYSLDFDGVDENINFGNVNLFSQDSPFSISFWVKEMGSRQGYISKTSTVYNGFVLFQNYSTLRFHLGSSEFSNRIQVSSTWTGTQGVWTHVVATYDGSGDASGVKLYGNNIVGQSISGDDLSTDVSNSSDFVIGTADVLGSFNGNMMEVSIYDTELSASDVALLFNETGTGNGVPIDPRNVGLSPTFYCPMVGASDSYDGTNWTIIDEVSGNNGTSVNMELADKTSETP